MQYDKIISDFFTDLAGFETGEVTADTTIASLGLDSIDVAEAIMGIEDETGVTVTKDDWAVFVTVGDVINHVKKD